MKKNYFEILERISLTIILILALVGSIFIGTIAHEMSHWSDYKEIAQDDYICLINMPADDSKSLLDIHGAYYYNYNKSVANWQEKAEKIDRITELKAYTIQIAIVLFLFFGAAAILFVAREKNKRNYTVNEIEKIKFWQNVLRENNFEKKIKSEQIGSRKKFQIGKNFLYEENLIERFAIKF